MLKPKTIRCVSAHLIVFDASCVACNLKEKTFFVGRRLPTVKQALGCPACDGNLKEAWRKGKSIGRVLVLGGGFLG
jgi:hypothetical protein